MSDSEQLLVAPGEPERSMLYARVQRSAGGQKMPPSGPMLSEEGLKALAGWICAGAPAPSASSLGPAIASLAPTSGTLGTTVEISGSGFAAALSGNIVQFGAVTAIVLEASATKLTTHVPGGATTGKISVRVGGKTATSASDFVVTAGAPVPVIRALTPCGTVAGSGGFNLTVLGEFFEPNVTLQFGGASVAAVRNSSTQVSAVISPGLIANAPASRVISVELANGATTSQPYDFGLASKVVTLTTDVQAIFDASCMGSGCHAGSQSPNLGAEFSYDQLVGASSTGCGAAQRVQACAPTRAKSSLVDKLLSTNASPPCSGSPMPQEGALKKQDELMILDWIAQGAPQ
jgi:hypothetical protein